jgi:hypothetical protein
MIDLATLGLLSFALMGLIAGDAVLNANTLSVNITVPARVAERGFTREAAEHIFAAEASRLVSAPSTLAAPTVRISSQRNVIGVLAEPLRLGEMTTALQDLFGLQPLRVRGVLLEEEGRQRLVLTVSNRDIPPRQLTVTRTDHDPVALVRDGANATFDIVSPYRVALTNFRAGVAGEPEALDRARAGVARALRGLPARGGTLDTAGLLTISGLLQLFSGDVAAADTAFVRAAEVPGLTDAARSVGDMNLAFTAIAERRPADALALARSARLHAERGDIRLAGFTAHVDLLEALAAWASQDLPRAEALLRRAAERLPENDTAHIYLVTLYRETGQTEAMAQAQRRVDLSRTFAGTIPAIAASLFWIDPATGAIQRRED